MYQLQFFSFFSIIQHSLLFNFLIFHVITLTNTILNGYVVLLVLLSTHNFNYEFWLLNFVEFHNTGKTFILGIKFICLCKANMKLFQRQKEITISFKNHAKQLQFTFEVKIDFYIVVRSNETI